MNAADIEHAITAAGFAVYESEEYQDGLKAIVSKETAFQIGYTRGFGTYWHTATGNTWFTVVAILYTATADEIAASLEAWWREDNE